MPWHLRKSTRRGLFTHAAACYHDQPEYLWATAPNYAVLRHPENRKWYALVMDLPREKLGLPGGGITDVVELKCDPAMAGSLRGRPGILPGYHMNRENWITVLLDGSFDPGQLAFLLDISHSLTGLRRQKAKAPRLNRDWLIPANPAYYDIEQDFAKGGHHPLETDQQCAAGGQGLHLYGGAGGCRAVRVHGHKGGYSL